MGIRKGESMNFSNIAKDLGKQSQPAVDYILSLKVSDAKKKELLTKLFNATGYSFYNKMFADNSELFDSQAIGTAGFQNPGGQVERLSSKLVQDYNLTRVINPTIRGFYDSVLGDAEYEAFENALSLNRHPTLTREMRGETCAWCKARAGTFTDPSGDLFARHDNCNCLFITRGYNSRNGVLKNYTKNSSSTVHARELSDISREEIDRLSKDFDKNYYKPNSGHKKVYNHLDKTQAKIDEKLFQIGNYIQEKTGYSNKYPTIVSREDFEKIKGVKIKESDVIYRGWHSTSPTRLREHIEEFKNGKIYNNYSSRGYGSYFSTSGSAAGMYASTNNSLIMEAKILPGARILKIDKGWSGYNDIKTKLLKQFGLSDAPASSIDTNVLLANDLGSLGALSGYDIIDMSNDLQNIVLVLNREKVVIPDA